jgi:hypothetical protein
MNKKDGWKEFHVSSWDQALANNFLKILLVFQNNDSSPH